MGVMREIPRESDDDTRFRRPRAVRARVHDSSENTQCRRSSKGNVLKTLLTTDGEDTDFPEADTP